MRLGGLQKTTLLDFPGQVACTVFTSGCNLHCPFCHNASLVLPPKGMEELSENAFFSFLSKRKNILDGVAVTGGEPLLHPDIGDFLAKIRSYGFKIKLDTNGSYPERLASLVLGGLVDYVAMDIKNSPSKYAVTAGKDVANEIRESVNFLLSGKVEYEFRTTAVSELHCATDFAEIGKWIQGADRYYIQSYVDSGDILDDQGFSSPTDQEMQDYLKAALPYVPNATIRGR